MTAPRQGRRTIGSQGHHHPIFQRGKRSNHGVKWLSNSIYCVLGLMVLHLMTSQGDAPQIPGSRLRGRTTKTKSQSPPAEDALVQNKKLPSYRKPEHHKNIKSDTTLFETILHHNDDPSRAAVSSKTTFARKEEEEASLTRQMDNSENDSNNNSWQADNKLDNSSNEDKESNGQEYNGEPRASSVGEGEEENNDNKYSSEPQEKINENDQDDEEIDIADNVGALKASVDDVLLRLRKAAQARMQVGMTELQPDLQEQKRRISTMLSLLAQKIFPGRTARKVEEYVHGLLEENIAVQFQEQLDLLLAQASDDIDTVVAEYEEKELDVIEMDHRLTNFETERRPLIEGDVQSIANSLKSQLPYAVSDVAKDALESLFPLISLEFDDYGRLKMDPSSAQGILLTEKEILAAIESARADASEDEGSEDAVKTKQKTSHDEGDHKQDSQNGDGGDEEQDQDKKDTDNENSATTFRTSTSWVRGQRPNIKAYEEPGEYNADDANNVEDNADANGNNNANRVAEKRIQTFSNIATDGIGDDNPLVDGTGNANEEQANDNEEGGDDDDDEVEAEDGSANEMSAASNATMSGATERLSRMRNNGLSGALGSSIKHKIGLQEEGSEIGSKNHFGTASNVGGSNYYRPKVLMENENAGLSGTNYGPGRMDHAKIHNHYDNENEQVGEVKATSGEEQADNEDEEEGEAKASSGEDQEDSATAIVNPIFNNEQPQEEDEEKRDTATINPSGATQAGSNDAEGAYSLDGTTTAHGALPEANAREAEDEDSGEDIAGANTANSANPPAEPLPVEERTADAADTNGGGDDDDETEDA